MKTGERFFQGIVGLMIGFLAVYSGCLIWSAATGNSIGWVDRLQGKIVESCLSVTGSNPDRRQAVSDSPALSWKEEVWHLASQALNWPILLTEPGPEDPLSGSGQMDGGEDLFWQPELGGAETASSENIPARNGIVETSLSETEETSPAVQTEEQEGKDAAVPPDPAVQHPAEETAPASVAETEVPKEMISKEALPAAAAVPVLLPAEGNVRPEITALPEIADLSSTQMLDFSYLLKRLYVVNAGCSVTEDVLNPGVLLSKNLTISHGQGDYEILIYHTHSQEAFADSVPGDTAQTVVGLGTYLTTLLEEKGYRVLHCTDVFDMENGVLERDHAYERALPVLEQILAEHPSIQVVIDLHRDGVADQVHLVTDVDGAATARIMFFNGMCRNEAGERSDVTNPYREDNLAFSLQSALQLEAAHPGMLRVIYLKQSRYNQHLRSRSMLVEVGAQTNSVEEVYHAIPIVAETLEKVLQ